MYSSVQAKSYRRPLPRADYAERRCPGVLSLPNLFQQRVHQAERLQLCHLPDPPSRLSRAKAAGDHGQEHHRNRVGRRVQYLFLLLPRLQAASRAVPRRIPKGLPVGEIKRRTALPIGSAIVAVWLSFTKTCLRFCEL